MNTLPARLALAAAIAASAFTPTGCAPPRQTGAGQTGPPQVATSTTPTAENTATSLPATGAAPATASAAATSPAPAASALTPLTPPPAPTPPATGNKPKLGPKDAAQSWAYLTDMYKKDGYWYVVVDYIQVVGPEETIHFVNENPKLRTFPLAEDAKLQLLKNPGSPDYKSVSVSAFKSFQNKPGKEVVQVTPKGGYAVRLKQWWAP